MTDEKIFTPTRVPQGSSDAAIYFQQIMEKCFASLLYMHLLVWIDDTLLLLTTSTLTWRSYVNFSRC